MIMTSIPHANQSLPFCNIFSVGPSMAANTRFDFSVNSLPGATVYHTVRSVNLSTRSTLSSVTHPTIERLSCKRRCGKLIFCIASRKRVSFSLAAASDNLGSTGEEQFTWDENVISSDGASDSEGDGEAEQSSSEGEDSNEAAKLVKVNLEHIGKNARRISATICIAAPLEVVWNVITDYEKLVDFLPGLAVSQMLERRDNGARLFQVGQQNLAFGLKFRAKGIVDVYEKPMEVMPNGIRRDIDFEMVEGDFQVFQGTWRMEQVSDTTPRDLETPATNAVFQTHLSYIVNVQPKLWLPVRLVEGKLSSEIQVNLVCARKQVMKLVPLHAC